MTSGPPEPHTLGSRLRNSAIEWPSVENSYFIPVDVLHNLITDSEIRTELIRTYPGIQEAQLSNYTRRISDSARRLYASLLYCNRGVFIRNFLDEGITDKDFPFVRSYRKINSNPQVKNQAFDLCRRDHEDCPKSVHSGCKVKATACWEQKDIRDFFRDQWVVHAPIFDKTTDGTIPHYDFDKNIILPYVEDHEIEDAKKGGYSIVWGVRTHSAHQSIFKSEDPRVIEPLLAIKRPFSQDGAEFEKERNMLCQIAVRDHPHLIKLLFTYKFKNHYHLVFPFANTNLRGYWNDTGLPYWNKDTYCWFLHQIRGIASGLNAIHNYNTNLPLFGTRLTMPGSNITQSGLLKVEKGEDKYGRHGDIKPENILWSNELAGSGVFGKLQITDLGCGRFHSLESRSGVNAAGIPKTPTYMPPEVPLGHGISRAYDIWSFGCVVLEFVTWLLEGPQSIYGFSSARGLTALDGINDDTFFTVTENNGRKTAALREGVKTWIARLRTSPRCSDMIKDLLDLVEFQLLAIDPKQRLNSEKVDTELRIIRERANNNLVYLLGTNPPASDQHLRVKLPKGPDTKYAPSTDELQPTPPPEDTPTPDVQHNLPAIRIDRADNHADAPDRKRK